MEGLVSELTCLLENSLVDKNRVWSANRDSFLTSPPLTALSTFSSSNFFLGLLFLVKLNKTWHPTALLTFVNPPARHILYGICAHSWGREFLEEATAITKANVGTWLHGVLACVGCRFYCISAGVTSQHFVNNVT